MTMKPEVHALWALIDLLRQVQIGLLSGLQKPAVADENKFPLETRNLFRELASLIHGTFNLSHPASFAQAPAEYQQTVVGLAEAVGLQNPISQMREEDAARWLGHFCADLRGLAEGKQNHRDGIKRILRICRALEGECLMVCNTPPEKAPRKNESATIPDAEPEGIAYG